MRLTGAVTPSKFAIAAANRGANSVARNLLDDDLVDAATREQALRRWTRWAT
jgi:hypothetical protein